MNKPRIAPKASYEQDLLTAARDVARLQAKRRRLRRQLRELDADLRTARKMLRALAARNDDRQPDVMPSRLTNGATGYARPTSPEEVAKLDLSTQPLDTLIDEAFFEAFKWCDACQSSHHPTNTQCTGLADLVALDPSTRGQK